MKTLWLLFVTSVTLACKPAVTPEPIVETAPVVVPEAKTDPPAPTPDLGLYRAAYGDTGHTVVYLHGGPGHNSALFEATTAEALAERYRVVAYDRRGVGRSPPAQDAQAFTFDQAIADLDAVLAGTESPVLLGHSFGGLLAVSYLEAHPDFDGQVILVNAPIVFQRTLSTIISNCREVYAAQRDEEKLTALEQLEAMDPDSAQYLTISFFHGLSCGLYFPSNPTLEAKALGASLAKHPDAKWFSDSQPMPVYGFLENEHYNTTDLSRRVELQHAKISAIYSDEDRIISPEDRAFLQETLGERYVEVKGAAHNVFIDQQPAFIEALDQLTR